MIDAAFRATAPYAATAVQIEKGPPIDGRGIVDGMKCGMIILALCVGAGLIVYVVRKTRFREEGMRTSGDIMKFENEKRYSQDEITRESY